MNTKKSGILLSIIAFCLAITLLLTSCSPVRITRLRAENFESQVSANAGVTYHRAKRDGFELICQSGLIELYFDEKTSAIGVLDKSADVFWSSLPQENEKSIAASPLEIVLSTDKGEIYTLNSQDSSVYFGNMSFEKTKYGVNVKYALSFEDALGEVDISELPDGSPRADITVSYSLSDGSFYASLSMNNVHLPKGVYLEKIRLLNSFGAYNDENADDFIFVPDGIGAIIKTGIADADFSPVSLKVYGNDSAVSGNNDVNTALLGAFGIKHGKGAFLCIIENGETVATINANRNSENSFNCVGAEFAVTDVSVKDGKSKDTRTLGFTYGGELKLCYRFLSGKSATYSGMAAACRENLIRNSVISSKTVNIGNNSALPLIVNVQFGYCDEKGKLTVKSTYEQAEALMSLLKAKGVNNVYLRANGLFKNANNAESTDFGNFIKALGSKAQYSSLYSYMKTQNFTLYADTSVLSVSSGGARNIYGKGFALNSGASAKDKKSLKMSDLENRIEELLYASSEISFDGFALNDIALSLYSDYSSDIYPRESSKKEIASLIPVLSSSKPIMIDNGNFYAIKNATVITALPQGILSRDESNAYCAIPFLPLLLHGIYDYGISSMNLSSDIRNAFLKTVELGALPTASWYCAKAENDDKYGYDNNINEIVSYYVKINDILSDLRDARMTSHQEVQTDVYCTEYNNSTKVYVNYMENPVTINGITVNAHDCVKIS